MDDGKGECSSQLWLELVMLCYVWLQKRRRGRIQGAQKWFAEATVETGSTQMNILFCILSNKEKKQIFCTIWREFGCLLEHRDDIYYFATFWRKKRVQYFVQSSDEEKSIFLVSR